MAAHFYFSAASAVFSVLNLIGILHGMSDIFDSANRDLSLGKKKNNKKLRFPAAYTGKSLRNSMELQPYTSND